MIYRLAFSISQRYLVSMRNRYLSKAVDPSQNIADLGSGNNPFRHARVCVDKFDSDDIQVGANSRQAYSERNEGRRPQFVSIPV
jgi:hypothetical protein